MTICWPTPATKGSATILLSYRDQVICRQIPGAHFGNPITVCTAGVTAETSTDVTVAPNPARLDSDMDGITDIVESELLARFRPYYRFSTHAGDDETSRPADALSFVRHSEMFDDHTETGTPLVAKDDLAQDPAKILRATSLNHSSTMDTWPHKTGYYLNLYNEFRSGEADWNIIKRDSTGLYGHVAPLHEDSNNLNFITAYKIEYWQFYAFNPAPGQIDCYNISDAHEGDWEGVELVVEADKATVRRTRHNIHTATAEFDLITRKGPPTELGGGIVEYRGPNEATWKISVISNGPLGTAKAQNNLVRFFCNEDGCTHPVVYIEFGGHASWPTEYWEWPGVLNHDGDSQHAYLVATPPNLGEIGHPNRQCLGCELVVSYNGHWGACGDDPPEGPSLHRTWGKP